MENPEALLDALSMETFRQRFASHPNNGHQGFHTSTVQFLADDDQLENIVRDLCIDDSISGCFADSESEAKDTFDLKVWLPDPKKDPTECRDFLRSNIDPSDTVGHFTSSSISDENRLSLHGLQETRWKKPLTQRTECRQTIGQHLDIGDKDPFRSAPSTSSNMLDESSADRSFNYTHNFSKTPAKICRVSGGLWGQSRSSFDTENKAAMCNQSIPFSQRTSSSGSNESAVMEKKRVEIFHGKSTESIYEMGGLNVSPLLASSSSASITSSQSLNIDTQSKKPVFQRMAFKPRVGRKRTLYQDQGLVLTDKSHAHSKTNHFQTNESSNGSCHTEVTSAKDRNAHDKFERTNALSSSLTSNAQMSFCNEEQEMLIPEEEFTERICSIGFENNNPLALESENPEPYDLPSFPTTSEDLAPGGRFEPELLFNVGEFQDNRQAHRRAVISHHLPDDVLESLHENSLAAKKGKHRKPWYEVSDRHTCSKNTLNTNQNVDLRAVIEESARVLSPELDTPSDDPVDERIPVIGASKSSVHMSGNPDVNEQISPSGPRHGRNHSPPRKSAFQGVIKTQFQVPEGCMNSNALDHLYANICSSYITTDLNTSVSSGGNGSSTSVSSSTKTLPSLIPIITNNADRISPDLSSKANTISSLTSPIMKNSSGSVSANTDHNATSVSSAFGVFSTSLSPRHKNGDPLLPVTSALVPLPMNAISTSLSLNNLAPTTSSVLSNANTALLSAVPSTAVVASTSDSLNMKTIPKTVADLNNSETSVQLNIYSAADNRTVINTSNMNEFNEKIRTLIYRDEQDLLRKVTLSDSFIHADWKYDLDDQLTPFHLAIQVGRLECLRILIESQPLLDRYGWNDGLGLDLARTAVKSNQVQCLLLLHNMMDAPLVKGSVDEDGNTLMHLAASLNHTDITVALLSLGHDVNQENKAGISPLSLCLQHSALSRNVDPPTESHQESIPTINSDDLGFKHETDKISFGGAKSSRTKADTSSTLDSRTVQVCDQSNSQVQNDENTLCPNTGSSVMIDRSDTENDKNDNNIMAIRRQLPVGPDVETLEKEDGRHQIEHLILTELMRCTSKLDENGQKIQPDDVLQGSTGASAPEAYIRQYILQYAKSLQENQEEISHGCKDQDNLSQAHKVNSKQILTKTEKVIEKGNNCSTHNDYSPSSPPQKQKVEHINSPKATVQDRHTLSVEQTTNVHKGSSGDRKSDISSQESKSKEVVDSFCISSDELYNSPPDKIPSVPAKPRSSRQPHSARARPADSSTTTTTTESTGEARPLAKTHERGRQLHSMDVIKHEFKDHKSKSDISYILDSSSTSQDHADDRAQDYLNGTSTETARRREARRRRWGGLSLLPHHLKKKIERLSQKGKRKTTPSGISGSSNSSSSIVTSSSSSGGGRGDLSAEGGSSVRAIVDFRDVGQDQHYFNAQPAMSSHPSWTQLPPNSHHTPMHVTPTGNAKNVSSLSNNWAYDARDSRNAGGRSHAKHESKVTNHHYDFEHRSERPDSDQFWRSTDTFSSMTTLSKDNGIDVINSIGDVDLDDGQDSVSGFHDARQSRSHRHHHHHGNHHYRRSRSSDQSERDRYYHNHRCHHRRRRREALGCSPSRRRHRRSYNGSDEHADVDEGDNDTDEDEESDGSDDPRVRVNVDNEDLPDEMLRVQRLAKHLESVQRLQTANCQVIETVVTGTGEVLTSQHSESCDPNHVNIGEAYPFSSIDRKGKRTALLHTKRTTSPSGLVGRRAKIHLFNHEKVNAERDIKTSQKDGAGLGNMEATCADRYREMDRDIPWNLLTFSDSEDTDFGEMNSR